MDENDVPRNQSPPRTVAGSMDSVLEGHRPEEEGGPQAIQEEEGALPQAIESLVHTETPVIAAAELLILADGHVLKGFNGESGRERETSGGAEAVLIEGGDKPSFQGAVCEAFLPATLGTNKLHGFLEQDAGMNSAVPMDRLRAADSARTALCEDDGKAAAPKVLEAIAQSSLVQGDEKFGDVGGNIQASKYDHENVDLGSGLSKIDNEKMVHTGGGDFVQRANATKCLIQVKEGLAVSSSRLNAQENCKVEDQEKFNAESSELHALERTSQSSVDNYAGRFNTDVSTQSGVVSRREPEGMLEEHTQHIDKQQSIHGNPALLSEIGARNVSCESAAVHSCQHKKDLSSSHCTDTVALHESNMGAQVGDKFYGSLLKTEQSADLGSPNDEVDGTIFKYVKAFETTNGERVSDEIDEEHFAEKLSKVTKEEYFGTGDLVWAKVKSHPWWPAQIFDAADASASAKKVHKSGRVLVAFFGDGTFGWLQQSQLVEFEQNFKEKVKQTTMKSFCKAVSEALDEVCRRAELGLSCSCHGGVLHSAGTFPDANAGIQKGVRIECHKDMSMSKEMFNPEKTLEFIKSVACSPCGSWSSSLEASALRGHAYGFRTGIFDIGRSNSDDLLLNVLTVLQGKAGQIASNPAKSSKLKRRFSSLESNSMSDAMKGKEAKKANIERIDMQTKSALEGGCQLVTGEMPTGKSEEQSHKESKEGTFLGNTKRASVMKEAEGGKKPRRCHSSGFERDATEIIIGKGAEDEKGSEDAAETLFSLAGLHHSKIFKRLGKGKLQGEFIKNVADGKVGLKNKVDRQCIGGAQEVKPTESNLELNKNIDKSLVGDGTQVVSESSLPVLAAANEEKASELRTDFLSDLKLNDTEITETSKKLFNTNILLKDKKRLQNAEKFPVPVPRPVHMQDENINCTGTPSITKYVNQSPAMKVKKSPKTVKLGKRVQRIVGEVTGTPSITKHVNQSSAMKVISKVPMKPGLKNEKRGSASELSELLWNQNVPVTESVNEDDGDAFVQLVQGLQSLAKDPLNTASSKRSLSGITAAFLKLRDIVFQKSEGYVSQFPRSSEQDVVKPDAQLDNVSNSKLAAVMPHACSLNVPYASQKHDVPGAQLDKSDAFIDPKLISSKSPRDAQQIMAVAGQKHDVQDGQAKNSDCLSDSKIGASDPKNVECAVEKHDMQGAQLDTSNHLSDPKLIFLSSRHSENTTCASKRYDVQTAELDNRDHLTDAKLIPSKSPPRLQNMATRISKRDVKGAQLGSISHHSDGKSKVVKSQHGLQNVASTSHSRNVAHTVGTAPHSQNVTCTFQEHDVQDAQLSSSNHLSDLKPVISNLLPQSENVAHAGQKHDVQVPELDNRDHLVEATLRASKSQPRLQNMGNRIRKCDVQSAQLNNIDHLRGAKLKAVKSQPCSKNVAPASQISDVQAAQLGKRDHASDPKLLAPKSEPCSRNVTLKGHKHDVQELAQTSLKRKSEVLKEGLARLAKKSFSASVPQGQRDAKAGTSTGKSTEQSHRGQQLKHHPRRASTPESDVRSHVQQPDNRLSSKAPVGLFMKFPQSFALPSEAQLKATFIRFGTLQTSETRVYRKTATAQVVFKNGCDAERAFKYSTEHAIFGQAAVSFRLRHFSSPERSDMKKTISAVGKENSSVRADERTSSLSMERTEGQNSVANSLSLSRLDKGRAGLLAGFPASTSNGDTSLKLSSLIPNSASTVKDSSGDIQDQMIKLLRQVSVIVSSSNLPTEAT